MLSLNVLFLDDSEARQKSFRSEVPSATIVATAEETIEALSEPWDLVFLDHDLGDEVFVDSDREDCGMEVVRWIVEHKPSISKIFCHSLNRDARIRMGMALDAAGYDVEVIPFIVLQQAGFHKVIEEYNGDDSD